MEPLIKYLKFTCPTDLAERIIKVIERKKIANYYAKMIVFGSFALISISAFVIALKFETPYIINSGAGKLISLLFSDSSIVLTYWQQYLLSIIQSLPFTSIVIVAVCLWMTCVFSWKTARASVNLIRHKIHKHA